LRGKSRSLSESDWSRNLALTLTPLAGSDLEGRARIGTAHEFPSASAFRAFCSAPQIGQCRHSWPYAKPNFSARSTLQRVPIRLSTPMHFPNSTFFKPRAVITSTQGPGCFEPRAHLRKIADSRCVLAYEAWGALGCLALRCLTTCVGRILRALHSSASIRWAPGESGGPGAAMVPAL
jgi:hypothetical protein